MEAAEAAFFRELGRSLFPRDAGRSVEWPRVHVDRAFFASIVEALRDGDVSAERLGKWGPPFNRGIDRMRRLVCEYYDGFSFGRFVRTYPHLKGTVTDLLIGDLFTDRVDCVWEAMESLYPAGRTPPPAWDAEAPEPPVKREGDLVVPEGYQP